ncbi:UDP-3-O-(3-hydroxymyristoyl)glucosamine N-acyltransferase [Gloeocapsa sp. PCC 73106]|uniref:UDP-3-O-(3-hydroxymyristoyl)glucosamine N-acyltransferase n=1 Tax=Gloeocapsa sp. PCC 73106 TaxID=102232 RepID=UPI0002AD14ED|nr:UDP-3-O-(3-hydroxymyristoyl)glucosamine N-acyltransferase [Gloeocapsa sp. PCC 73106]ELR96505.1 UDP-3-O-(3-hydroxymyristoyl) glucosamine N-acyltransferase [Gloeocapsa sp. PCC 73106]
MNFSQIILNLASTEQAHSLTSNPECDPEITEIGAVDQASPGMISYIEGKKYAGWVAKTEASALILPPDPSLEAIASHRGIAWLSSREPRLSFARVIDLFYQPFRPESEIHPTAVIAPEAQIGKNVYIGPHVVIYPDVIIGDDACIYANVVIYPQVEIGQGTILHANCTIHERSKIGINCVIHSGAVIGAEGFGFVPIPQGWYKMQQSGITVLEDGVEIGCNTTIDRPAVGETRVGKNTKIDNLVHIGHGCTIGSNCALAGQVGLAGGVVVGNGVILAGQVGIVNQAKIGDGAIASARAGIHNNVKPREIVSGTPAMSHQQFLKIAAIIPRLPEIYQFFKENKLK